MKKGEKIMKTTEKIKLMIMLEKSIEKLDLDELEIHYEFITREVRKRRGELKLFLQRKKYHELKSVGKGPYWDRKDFNHLYKIKNVEDK